MTSAGETILGDWAADPQAAKERWSSGKRTVRAATADTGQTTLEVPDSGGSETGAAFVTEPGKAFVDGALARGNEHAHDGAPRCHSPQANGAGEGIGRHGEDASGVDDGQQLPGCVPAARRAGGYVGRVFGRTPEKGRALRAMFRKWRRYGDWLDRHPGDPRAEERCRVRFALTQELGALIDACTIREDSRGLIPCRLCRAHTLPRLLTADGRCRVGCE